jgi:hypothetical protein
MGCAVLAMRSFWSDPYLWIHLAGLATLPLWLELCLLALAVGDPILPVWLELFFVAGIGIGPIVWMQWVRPFDIYSLLAVSLKPEQLTEDQRKLLTLFTTLRNRILSIVVAVLLAIALQKLYVVAPIAATITPFALLGRLTALLIAAIAFLGANLFTQVPVAVLSVLFTSEATFAATLPFATDQVRQRFTLLGFPVNRILPPLVLETTPVPAIAVPQPTPAPLSAVSPIATPTVTPNVVVDTPEALAREIDDIWGDDSIEGSLDARLDPATVASPAELAQPDEKPDWTPDVMKSEAVTTEETFTPEDVVAEALTTDTDTSWMDAPVIEDPAAADPPNSL